MVANFKNPEPGEVLEYFRSKGVEYHEVRSRDEIQFPCPNNDCDTSRRHPNKKDFHCSINTTTGQYRCVKCGESGNLLTLKRLWGDDILPTTKNRGKNQNIKDLAKMATKCHKDLDSVQTQEYFVKERGLSLQNIEKYQLGYGEFYGRKWYTIPIYESGQCKLIKLRRMPNDTENPNKYIFWPKGAETILFGGDEILKSSSDSVLICGGEFDKMIAEQMDFGMPVITSTAGEPTFKDEWIDKYLANKRTIYIAFDNDETGKESMQKLAARINEKYPTTSIIGILIPEELGEHADITDAYKNGIAAKKLLDDAILLAGPEPIDVNKFKEMSVRDLANILDLTIKYDEVNKVVVFLGMLSAYTEKDQLNIFLNAQSSSGKSYIVQEVQKLFPKVDVKIFAKVTPTAFYYNSESMKDREDGVRVLDLERKILIFLDQIDTQLQANLRPFLSHDDKELPFLNTNKNKKGSNDSKTACIRGFSATFFCSANMRMDEQEQTRAFLLSPEISQEKIQASIDLAQEKMNNETEFAKMLASNEDRKNLIDRIFYIKSMRVENIIIPKEYRVHEIFKASLAKLQPRNQRDIQHLNSLIKVLALLNAPFREKQDKDIVANKNDVEVAIRLWKYLNRSQKYGIPPQTLDFYEQFIVPAYNNKNKDSAIKKGITFGELATCYLHMAGNTLNREYCMRQLIPVLESASLVSYEKDPDDGKQKLITPLVFDTKTDKV